MKSYFLLTVLAVFAHAALAQDATRDEEPNSKAPAPPTKFTTSTCQSTFTSGSGSSYMDWSEGDRQGCSEFCAQMRRARNQVLVSFGSAEDTRRVITDVQSDGTCWWGDAVARAYGDADQRVQVGHHG